MLIYLWYLLLSLLCCLILSFVLILKSGQFPTIKRYRAIQKLPGPKGVWLLGNALELKNVPIEDLLIWLTEKMKNHKRFMRLWLLVVSNVYIKDPDDIQTLFNNTQYINKGHEYIMFRSWLDEGLLTSSGEKWHSRRKLLTPAFHFKILEDNMINFNKCSKVLCEKLKNTKGEEIDIESFTTLCTLDIIMGTAMGIDLQSQTQGSQEYVSQLKRVTQLLTERMMRPQLFLDWMFNLSNTGKEFYKSVKYLHDYSYRVIRERRKEFFSSYTTRSSSKKHKAFLDKMLEFESVNPGSFNDKDLREEVDTFMFEGHDTTSAALVFIFFNLATYPDIQERVYEELSGIFNSENEDVTVTDLNKMVYLEKVIKESLRLFPSVPAVARLLEKDLILNDGTLIPTHTNVITPIFLVHRNEKHWEEPEKFDPERFSEEQVIKRHPYAYIPFSAGQRNCIGQRFAMMELKTVVSTVIRQLKIEPVSKREDFKAMLHLVLRSSKPIKCRFVPRN